MNTICIRIQNFTRNEVNVSVYISAVTVTT